MLRPDRGELSKKHRLRLTLAEKPSATESEGLRARWWRERVMKASRPELAQKLGLTARTIERYEELLEVPTLYRMACETLNRTRNPTWAWEPQQTTRRGLAIQYTDDIAQRDAAADKP